MADMTSFVVMHCIKRVIVQISQHKFQLLFISVWPFTPGRLDIYDCPFHAANGIVRYELQSTCIGGPSVCSINHSFSLQVLRFSVPICPVCKKKDCKKYRANRNTILPSSFSTKNFQRFSTGQVCSALLKHHLMIQKFVHTKISKRL